jgi:hypothetical protein
MFKEVPDLHLSRFHPSLGIPLIITGPTATPGPGPTATFPSLFRDSSDHHRIYQFQLRLFLLHRFHPSLGIPLIITRRRCQPLRLHLTLRFHPSLGIPLIITRIQCPGMSGVVRRFPSLFRDSSDHHPVTVPVTVPVVVNCFHPSLGIPLIITRLRQQRRRLRQQVSIPL